MKTICQFYKKRKFYQVPWYVPGTITGDKCTNGTMVPMYQWYVPWYHGEQIKKLKSTYHGTMVPWYHRLPLVPWCTRVRTNGLPWYQCTR